MYIRYVLNISGVSQVPQVSPMYLGCVACNSGIQRGNISGVSKVFNILTDASHMYLSCGTCINSMINYLMCALDISVISRVSRICHKYLRCNPED